MFTRVDLLKTAAIAGLELTEEEIPLLLREMEEIVAFAGQILQASPQAPSPSSVYQGSLREDETAASFSRSELLREAGETQGGYFYLSGRK